MKNYFSRLMSSAKKSEFIVWWIFRLIMIGAMVSLLFTNPPSDLPKTQMALQLFANLVGMFAWEIIQALPEKKLSAPAPVLLPDCCVCRTAARILRRRVPELLLFHLYVG